MFKKILGDGWRKFLEVVGVDPGPEVVNGHVIPEKLLNAVKKNYDRMESFRKQYAELVRQYAGEYGEMFTAPGEKNIRVPMNKIRQVSKIWMRLLASGIPQASVDTRYDNLKAFAESFQLSLNRHLQECNIQEPIERLVLESFFGLGVAKTALAEGDEDQQFEVEGVLYDIGRPFTEIVSVNNFVIDMEASSFETINFIGDRFRRPKSWVDAILKKRDAEHREGSANETLATSRMMPEDRVSGIIEDPDSRVYKEVWCWDIFLPKHNLMCLFAEGITQPLNVYKWDGPEVGPYTLLCYDPVPSEVMPSSPLANLRPLHRLINALADKLENQARRQKTNPVFPKGAQKDAETHRTAGDGEVLLLDSAGKIQEVRTGGPDPVNLNFLAQMGIEFNNIAGNPDILSGAGPQSETAAQDKLLHSSASALVDDMRRNIVKAVSRIVRKHAWYIWTDPMREDLVYKTIENTGIRIPSIIPAGVREGDFLDYNFSVIPHSLQETTPFERAQIMLGLWERAVLPNMQLLMQAGMVPNAAEFVKTIFELQTPYMQIENLFIPMEQQGTSPQVGQIPAPPSLKQTVNTRISRPGHTQRGMMQGIMAANANMAPQNGQQASMVRAV